MPLVGAALADKIRGDMGFPLPVSMQLTGWGTGVVSHIQTSSLVSFAPGKVTGVAPPIPPGPPALLTGAASDGIIAGLVGATMASLVKNAAGYPSVSSQLLAFCGAIAAHIMSKGKVAFATGTVVGVCTNTLISPGVFTGTGAGGTLSGLVGSDLADEVHAACGFPGSTSPELVKFCTAVTTYVMANAVVSGGVMTGICPAGGGPITAGSGTGGLIA